MEYLIRLAQMHETFRRPELEALAVLHNVDLEILEYSDQVREERQTRSFFPRLQMFPVRKCSAIDDIENACF